MFIYAQNKNVLSAYAEILKDFTPVLLTNKEEVYERILETDLVLIDEDLECCFQVMKKSNALILYVGLEDPLIEGLSYLRKPIRAYDLLQKVGLLMKKIELGLSVVFEFNGFKFCGRTKTINGISLTAKEAELIEFLYENKNQVVSKEKILTTIFGYHTQAQTHTLETHIYNLRQKIGDLEGRFITTQESGYAIYA